MERRYSDSLTIIVCTAILECDVTKLTMWSGKLEREAPGIKAAGTYPYPCQCQSSEFKDREDFLCDNMDNLNRNSMENTIG